MAAVTTSAGTVEVELESELVSELVESESTYPAKPFCLRYLNLQRRLLRHPQNFLF